MSFQDIAERLGLPADKLDELTWDVEICPYQRIDVMPIANGYRLLANGTGHQTMQLPGTKEPIYDFPYREVMKARADIDWTPQFGIEAGYRDSYEWFVREGRGRYDFDFSQDDALLAQLGR